MAIEIFPSNATLGATVLGVRLAHLTDAQWQEVLDAFHTYGVLVFPGQHLQHDEQIAFSRRLGALEPVGRTVPDGPPDIVRISNLDADDEVNTDPDSAAMCLLIGNMDWHADSSFRVPPARASMLSCERPSSTLGETEFADLRAAYDALDDDMRTLLDGRLVTHSYLYSQGNVGGLDSLNFTPEQRASMGPHRSSGVRRAPGDRPPRVVRRPPRVPPQRHGRRRSTSLARQAACGCVPAAAHDDAPMDRR